MKIGKKRMRALTEQAYSDGRRLIVPLVGFPGCELTGHSIKVAQQNHGVHFACIDSLVEELKPDAAFMLMDLSVEANALGLPVRFPTEESSSVELHPVKKLEDLEKYKHINILWDARIQSYIKTVEMMSIGLPDEVLTGAYVIGPLTLAGLLCSAEQIAIDSVMDPKKLTALCEFSTDIILEYTRSLVNAGADIICILEPTGAILGPEQFRKFSSYYVRHIMESYKYSGVDTVYHVCGNTMHLLKEMAAAGVDALSLDSPETGVDMKRAAEIVPPETILIGNVNPTAVVKDGNPELVKETTTQLLKEMLPYPNFILSTGCDLPPATPIENIKAMMEAGRAYKQTKVDKKSTNATAKGAA
jgi:uroporphyrinogen decarboxylase